MKPTFFNIKRCSNRWTMTVLSTVMFQLFVYSQANLSRNWQFGSGNQLAFTGGVPSYSAGGTLTNSLGCSAISDLAGNLLFYTDGITIFNSANSVMSNGTGLEGVNASQSALILKQPGSTSLYFVFTVGGYSTTLGLKYSVVDMSLAAGMGSVTVKNILIDPNCRDKLTAGKHCNGNDLWIVSTYDSSIFSYCSVPLTSTGIGVPITGSMSLAAGVGNLGQIKLSPNSRKFALSTFRNLPSVNMGVIQRIIADFDNATGQIVIANFNYPMYFLYGHNLASQADTYGIEFSPNTQYVYTNTLYQNIVRIDLCANTQSYVTLQESANQVNSYGNKRQFQLAPNGKIYVARSGTTEIGSINNPGSGIAVSYTPQAIFIGTNSCQYGLPNFPGFYFEQKPNLSFTYTSNLTCLTASFNTQAPCALSGYSVTGYQWSFGEPSSGANNSSFLQNPTHSYIAGGTYSVRLIRYFLCNTSDTVSQFVTISQSTLGVNTSTNCNGATATVQITGGAGPFNYLWSAGSQTNSAAAFSVTGIYSVTVTDLGAGNCIRNSSFSVIVPTISISAVVSPSLICFGSNTAQVALSINGGSGNYMYNYAPVTQSTGVFSNLSAGTHTFTISDFGFNCVLTKTLQIFSANPIALSAGANPTQVCSSGSIALLANANGGSGVFSYLWQPLSLQTNTFTLSPPTGNYIYTITAFDSMSCTTSQTVGFSVAPSPTLSVNSFSLCKGSTITMSATGAQNYTWQPGNITTASFSITPLNASTFTVTGKNLNGCGSSGIASVNVIIPAPVVATCNAPVCEGEMITFAVNPLSTYQWQGPNNFFSTIANAQIGNAQQINAGTYTLVTTDSNGCVSNNSVTVSINSLPQLSIVSSRSLVCLGQQVSLIASGATSYTWSTGNIGSALILSPTVSSVVSVSGTNALVNCSNSSSIQVVVSNCNLASINSLNGADESLVVFPNPNKGEFTVCASDKASYVITDLMGRVLLFGDLQVGNNPIKMSSPQPGIYFFTSDDGKNRNTTKIIVE